MLFSKPILFHDALRSGKAKALLPPDSVAGGMGADLTENSVASARVFEAQYLKEVSDAVLERAKPLLEDQSVRSGISLAEIRLRLKETLKDFGYIPPEGERGRITDLSSDQRINLMVETQVDLNRGFGQFAQGQDQAILDVYPAQELYRGEPRIEPRIWQEIWPTAAKKVDQDALRVFHHTGRMVARKDSPIWIEISDFELPYPPFKFNSGMKVEDVSRTEALSLGLIKEEDKVEPQSIEYAQNFRMSTTDLTQEMRDQILSQLGDGFSIRDGFLTRR